MYDNYKTEEDSVVCDQGVSWADGYDKAATENRIQGVATMDRN
jgi:hypothetical protein